MYFSKRRLTMRSKLECIEKVCEKVERFIIVRNICFNRKGVNKMRAYRTDDYKKSLIGMEFHDSGSDYAEHNGTKVKKVVHELTKNEYDREELSNDTNEFGKRRYLINCMYIVELSDGATIPVYEDEINPNYCGDYEK